MTTFGKFVTQSKECHINNSENNYEPMSVSITGDFTDDLEDSIASDSVQDEIKKYSDADKEVYELEKSSKLAEDLANSSDVPTTESVLNLSMKVQNAMSRLELLGVRINSRKVSMGIESTFSSTPIMTLKLVREGVMDAMGSAKDKVVKWFKEMWNKFRGWLSKNLGIFRTSSEKAKKILETLGKMKNKKVKENIELSDQYLLVRTCKQGPEGYEWGLVNLLNTVGAIGNAIIAHNADKLGNNKPNEFKTDHTLDNRPGGNKAVEGAGGTVTPPQQPQSTLDLTGIKDKDGRDVVIDQDKLSRYTEEQQKELVNMMRTTPGLANVIKGNIDGGAKYETILNGYNKAINRGGSNEGENPVELDPNTQTKTTPQDPKVQPSTTSSGGNQRQDMPVQNLESNVNDPRIANIAKSLTELYSSNNQADLKNADGFLNILRKRVKNKQPLTVADLNQAFGAGRYKQKDGLSPEEAEKLLRDFDNISTQSNNPAYYSNLIRSLLDNIKTYFGVDVETTTESFLSFSTVSREAPAPQPAPQPQPVSSQGQGQGTQQQPVNNDFAGHQVQASEELDEIENGIYEYFAKNQAKLNTQYNIAVTYSPVAGADSNNSYESNEVIAFVPDHNMECVGVILARQADDKRAKIERMKISIKDVSQKDSYNKPSLNDLENFIKACCKSVSKLSNYESKVSKAVNDINKIADTIDKFDRDQKAGSQSSTVAAPNNDDGDNNKNKGGSKPYTTEAYRKLGECVKLMGKTTSMSKMLVLVAAEALSFIESEDDSVNN